jgi:PAS domain S-box-containing protein
MGHSNGGAAMTPQPQLTYTDVLEHSLDAALLSNADGEILYANPALCDMLGYTAVELRSLGRDGIVDHADPRVAEGLYERHRTGEFRGVITMLRKDGSGFQAEATSKLFVAPDGVLLSVAFIRDIDEQVRRENALREANDALAAALTELRHLQGILPICAYCKSIRSDSNYWQAVETYLSSRAAVEFSHGICPTCYENHVRPMLDQSDDARK